MDLIGDFRKTLDDCEKLLAENSKYGKHGDGLLMTGKWYGVGLEARSVALRSRLQFHCTKTTFVLEPLKIEMQQTANANVETLIRQNRRILSGLGIEPTGVPGVPSKLAKRYEARAQNERPFESVEPFPRKHTINALLHHFSQSTINVSNYQRPSSEQFNSLLKTRWLFDKIYKGVDYQQMGASLSRALVSSVGEKLVAQYDRYEELELEVESIMTLDDEHFNVWVIEDIKPPSPSATEERGGEEKILELSLAKNGAESGQTLHVFRQTNTQLRLVETPISESGIKQVVSIHHFKCVPWYAVPNEPASANSLQICPNPVYEGDFIDMASKENVFALQRAFTNYKVMYSFTQVKWVLQRDRLHHKTLEGPKDDWSGIQIWQWDPLERWMPPSTLSGPSESRLSGVSLERRASTLAGDFVSTLPTKAASIISQGVKGGEVVASMPPKVPAIIIFTKSDGKLSFVYLPLEPGIHINRQRCACYRKNSDCVFVILENNPGSRIKFKTKIHRAANMQDWNLFLFAQPKPPEYASLETLDDAIELTLEFANVEERKRFQLELIYAIKKREVEQDGFDEVARKMRYHENKANRTVNDPTLLRLGENPRPSPGVLSPHLTARSSSGSSASTLFTVRPLASPTRSKRTSASSHTSQLVGHHDDLLLQQWAPKTLSTDPDLSSSNGASLHHFHNEEEVAPDQTLPRRMSSMTFVASPQVNLGEHTFHFPGTLPNALTHNSRPLNRIEDSEAALEFLPTETGNIGRRPPDRSINPIEKPTQTSLSRPRTIASFFHHRAASKSEATAKDWTRLGQVILSDEPEPDEERMANDFTSGLAAASGLDNDQALQRKFQHDLSERQRIECDGKRPIREGRSSPRDRRLLAR
jgi:hypothetical protein